MIGNRLRYAVAILTILGTFAAVFTAVRASEEIDEIDETLETSETCELSESLEMEETYVSEVEESVETFTETETEVSEEETYVEETEVSESVEETEVTEETEDIEYDVDSYVVNGWYVPAFDYNDDGTITYYLDDGTSFYSVPTDGLELPDFAWSYTGLRGYVDYVYGSVNNLDSAQMESLEIATNEILSGQGA